jgi:hypothetical protein
MTEDSSRFPAAHSQGLDSDTTQIVPRVAVDWYRSVPWWSLLSKSVSIGWRASHLIVSAVAIWMTGIGWWIGDRLFAPETTIQSPFKFFAVRSTEAKDSLLESTFRPFVELLGSLDGMLTLRGAAYLIFGFLWTVGLWSFVGGMLSRRSLMEYGLKTSVGWGPTFRLVCQRWASMVWAITMPFLAILGLILVPLVIGALGRLGNIGLSISTMLLIPAVFLSIGIGWCVAIPAFGFSLSVCAIVGEKKADAFDGLSRSAAYVFQRPMTVLLVLVVATGLGWLGSTILDGVLAFGEAVVWKAFQLGSGMSQDQLLDGTGLSRRFSKIASNIVPSLQLAFGYSFFWSASAAAYLTLRYEIDHSEFDDLDLQEIGEPVSPPAVRNNDIGIKEVVSPNETILAKAADVEADGSSKIP